MKIPLRYVIVVCPLVLLWGAYGVTVASSQRASEKVLLRHAREIMSNTTSFALRRVEDYLGQARTAEQVTRRLIESRSFDGDRQAAIESLLFHQLLAYPDFAGMYHAGPDGEFVYVSRQGPDAPGPFLTKTIRSADIGRTATLTWRGADFAPVSSERRADTFDPRKREWFLAAWRTSGTVWNQPYIFYTSRNPGITISGALRDADGDPHGVVAVDLEIDELSTFLAGLQVGRNGRAFLFTPTEQVVAFHDLGALRAPDGKGALRLATVRELDDPLCVATLNAVPRDGGAGALALAEPVVVGFRHADRKYLAMVTPFRDPRLPWLFGVYIPEDDYLASLRGNVRDGHYRMLIVSLAATVLGLVLAASVDRPIVRLTAWAQQIRGGHFRQGVGLRSVYQEIDTAGRAFEEMRSSLEGYDRANRNLQIRLRQAHLDTIFRLASCAEYKDRDTALHLKRISRYSGAIAEAMGLDSHTVDLIRTASPMHDIGKMGVPDDVLMKSGPYTQEERVTMQEHPAIGARILDSHDSDLIACAHEIASGHHERWDGKGYPAGKAGEAIPLAARIVAVADVFDALVAERCYKQAVPFDEAVRVVREGRGKHFDPVCVDAFLSVLGRIREIHRTMQKAGSHADSDETTR